MSFINNYSIVQVCMLIVRILLSYYLDYMFYIEQLILSYFAITTNNIVSFYYIQNL